MTAKERNRTVFYAQVDVTCHHNLSVSSVHHKTFLIPSYINLLALVELLILIFDFYTPDQNYDFDELHAVKPIIGSLTRLQCLNVGVLSEQLLPAALTQRTHEFRKRSRT